MPDALPLALTMGDPAGIGGEITFKAWSTLREIGPAFFMLGDPNHLGVLAAQLGLDMPIETIEAPEQAASCFKRALPVWPIGLKRRAIPGRPDPDNAESVVLSIRRAVRMALDRRVHGVVTNPISKAVLYAAGFAHPGHTEFLGELTKTAHPIMMLACPQLRVVPVTVHVGLRRALDELTTERIIDTARGTHAALIQNFGIAAPRLAIAGLNPHAGENGAMGTEEGRIIIPGCHALRAEGLDIAGPLPPDTMFSTRARSGYDAAICMYHDQALIPLKTLDMDGGVNVTLGLPIIRTSPDHGTAFDIAGKNVASSGSLIAALRMAAKIRMSVSD